VLENIPYSHMAFHKIRNPAAYPSFSPENNSLAVATDSSARAVPFTLRTLLSIDSNPVFVKEILSFPSNSLLKITATIWSFTVGLILKFSAGRHCGVSQPDSQSFLRYTGF
jgi:hypothetical protein